MRQSVRPLKGLTQVQRQRQSKSIYNLLDIVWHTRENPLKGPELELTGTDRSWTPTHQQVMGIFQSRCDASKWLDWCETSAIQCNTHTKKKRVQTWSDTGHTQMLPCFCRSFDVITVKNEQRERWCVIGVQRKCYFMQLLLHLVQTFLIIHGVYTSTCMHNYNPLGLNKRSSHIYQETKRF